MERLRAGAVARLIADRGLTLSEAQVARWIPGGRRATPHKPMTWRAADVERWLVRHGLERRRRLVTLDELARHTGLSYWTARRTYEPVVVLNSHCKWYEV